MGKTDKDRPHWVREREAGVPDVSWQEVRTWAPEEQHRFWQKKIDFWRTDDCGSVIESRAFMRFKRKDKRLKAKQRRKEKWL